MGFRRFFDRLQLRLHLWGLHGLAAFFARFGTPALPVEVDQDQRITLPDPIRVQDILSGEGWSFEEDPPAPLRAIEFDPTFRTVSPEIDPGHDLAFPVNRLVIN